jgi:hypothetical protein
MHQSECFPIAMTCNDEPETSPNESPPGGRPKSESDAEDPGTNPYGGVTRDAPPTPPAGPPPIKPN